MEESGRFAEDVRGVGEKVEVCVLSIASGKHVRDAEVY